MMRRHRVSTPLSTVSAVFFSPISRPWASPSITWSGRNSTSIRLRPGMPASVRLKMARYFSASSWGKEISGLLKVATISRFSFT